jgi:Raf kinase inhibitor-like YbhB/YbcL family protein
MKNSIYRSSFVFLVLVALALVGQAEDGNQKNETKRKKSMKISSSAFAQGAEIPVKYSRGGEDINPPLHIEGTPGNAKSLTLIMDDPDAPVGLFTHWLVWNMDPRTTEITEHSVPKGAVEGTNDYPNAGYGGPQPPSGTHRYYFKIFALDKTLDLRAGAKRKELDQAMKGHVIAEGQYMGRFTHRK